MNWGHKITIVIVVFLAGMLGMVYYASLQNNEMIDDHYYEKEIQYQTVIDAQQNLMNISSNTMIHQDIDDVTITFPAGSYEKLEKGSIEFLRNDSKRKDVQFNLQTDGSGQQSIPKGSLSKGMYKVRIKWSNDHTDYYREENLLVEQKRQGAGIKKTKSNRQ